MLRRFAVLAAVPMAIVVSSCSIGTPKPATYVTDVSATLNGVVSSNEEPAEVTYWFNYGTSTDYGTVTPDRTYQIPADSQDDTKYPVSEPISGLEPNTTYHYQVCTSPGIEPGSRGCTNQDQTFTTGDSVGRSGIAFSSYRNGTLPEIYAMNANGSGQTNLTNNPGQEDLAAWSPDGSRISFSSFRANNNDIYVMNADGSDQTRLTDAPGNDLASAWSPDGSKIAFTSDRDVALGVYDFEVYVMDADGGNETRLTFNSATVFDGTLSWSPDGSKLAFHSDRDGDLEIYVMNADGSDQTPLTENTVRDQYPAWSPDGSKIAFASERDSGNLEVYTIGTDGSAPTNLTNNAEPDSHPTWSPEGSSIAFQSRAPAEPSNPDIYRMNTDGTGRTRLTTNGSFDVRPAWSPRP